MPIEEIKEELKKKEHTVRNILNIRQRVNKYPLSMFYVDLEPKKNNKEIYKLQYLNNIKINVEPPNKKNTIIQCTRCQLYGHSKTYYKRPYKRVKCGGNHMTTECQKSKETPAKCALCSGQHTANYKGCTVYRGLQNARSKLSNRNQQIPGRQTIPQNNINPTNSQHNIQVHTKSYYIFTGIKW
jgi:hypothetical protein